MSFDGKEQAVGAACQNRHSWPLWLQSLTLSDDEKREARATDARAQQILDRVESLTRDACAALRGAAGWTK